MTDGDTSNAVGGPGVAVFSALALGMIRRMYMLLAGFL